MPSAAPVDVSTLPNGLTVIEAPISGNQMVSISLMARTGTRDGSAAEAGVLTLLSNAFYRGTKSTPDSDALVKRLDRIGASYIMDADTECTRVRVSASAEFADELMEILGELVTQATFDAEEIDAFKTLTVEAIEAAEASPGEWVGLHADETMWAKGSPLARPGYGDLAAIKRATPAQVEAAHRRVFNPAQLAVVIAGGGSVSQQAVAKALGGLKPLPVTASPKASWARGKAWHAEVRPSGTDEGPMVTLNVGVPLGRMHHRDGSLDAKRTATMTVLDSVLSAGMSSRLFYNVREKYGLCYHIHSEAHITRDAGSFHVITWASPENVERTLNLAFDQLRQLATGDTAKGGLSDIELNKARAQTRKRVAQATGKAHLRSNFFGTRWATGRPTLTTVDLLASYNAVTADDVRDMAREIVGNLHRSRIAFVAPTDMGASLIRAIGGAPQQEMAS